MWVYARTLNNKLNCFLVVKFKNEHFKLQDYFREQGNSEEGVGGDRHDRGERRPRPEQQTEAPKEEQPKDFSDSLDNMDF